MSKINREIFFSKINDLNEHQKENINTLLDYFDNSEVLNRLSHYAFCLGNMAIETNHTFQPVIEGYWINSGKRVKSLYDYYTKNNHKALDTIFPNGLTYPTYEGRGFVQITHNFNYQKFQSIIKDIYGVDIVENPDLCLKIDIAFKIMEQGITDRNLSFTGKILDDFFTDDKQDFHNSRRIINGLDRADIIESRCFDFFNALEFMNE